MHDHLNIISFHNSSEPSYWQYQRLINKTVTVKKDVFISDRHLSGVSIQLTFKKQLIQVNTNSHKNSVKYVSDCSHILNEIIFLSRDVASIFRHNRAPTQLEEISPWNCIHINCNSSNSILLFVQHLIFYKIVSYSNLVLTRVP